MARVLHNIEKGIRISGENSDTLHADILFGSAAPGADGDVQDAAALGSLYMRSNGSVYKKIASANALADWSELGDVTIDELSWRNELVRAATNDTVAAGSVDPTGFSDNESGLDGNDFAVGEYLIGDYDGTPALFEVTAVTSATDITVAAASSAIAANDTFVVQSFLPDSPASQEAQAIVHSPDGSSFVKIADLNWNFADGINMAAAYSSAGVNGDVSSADSVNSAIEKLEGNQQDIQSASGLTQGDVNYGTFTGDTLADNQTSKQLFQAIEGLLEQNKGVEVAGITAITTVDSVLVDDTRACKWLVEVFEDASPANVKAFEVYALHDGTAAADATSADDTLYAKLKIGSNFNVVTSVDVNGTGAAQEMRLRVTSSTAGVTVTARRIEVRKTTV